MRAVTEPLLELECYQSCLEQIKRENTPVFATGVIDVQKTHLLYCLKEHTGRATLVLTYSELRAKELAADLRFFTRDIVVYPAKDILFYSADVHSMETNRQRFLALEQLIEGRKPIVVASMEALLDRYPKKEIFTLFIISLCVGEVVDTQELLRKLICMGYERVEAVEAPGQVAMRGGILDVFSLTADEAVRIEFWDDEIDSIRAMNVSTQRSTEKLERTKIFPMRELVYEDSLADAAAAKITKEFLETLNVLKGASQEDTRAERLRENIGEDAERLCTERTLPAIGAYISYFYDDTVGLLDYIAEDTLICFDEPERIKEHMHTIAAEYEESMKGRIAQGYLLPAQGGLLFGYEDILHRASKFSQVLLAGISQKATDFRPKWKADFAVKSTPSFQKRVDLFCEELSYLRQQEYRILILAGSSTRAQRMAKELMERNVPAVYKDSLDEAIPKGAVWVVKGSVSKGFRYDYIRWVVFSDSELFGGKEKARRKKRTKNGTPIGSFTDLHLGDYVVHDNHGVGVFRGLEKIAVDGVQKDYMKISYRDGGNLFVPVNQMDMVQKYIGGGSAAAPKLNKLGGQDWMKAKLKARTAVKILAEDLVALYAKRAATKGHVYGKDTVWQKEFEESFEFEETQDQLQAIEDAKQDMQSDKVMDRLICGDVGYGKTEVAIRTAFKAVQEGKQVAFLVPTTILAQQHYNTFLQRMAGYPVVVELLSRFRTPKQQKESLKNLAGGLADIVIGTHRVLSKDVEFKDLGLIIVDEEQRFGVGHKERMKSLRENLDVLTLSATPIPRTLHMSLSGIRDMSLLEEPPQERHPVQTYVMESNPEFIREAIHRELARDGQVFYLHNRVESIYAETNRLQQLIPEANIACAHGQMSERELEDIMERFINGETDVLVCTTIIETGMDISNANTIIIQDADRMGLSQLYQLRGRVGRSHRLAYAYLMYRRDKVLKEVAEKRLQTIREFTEFGSGFKIAMRDLEIRGAGNLLGAEQHGHMEAIGYDMYCRLLEEEVRKHKGDTTVTQERFETSIDLQVSAYVPDFYIKNQEQRMEIYKKIAAVRTMEDYYDIQEEMEDRFGDLPRNVQTLLEVVLLKAKANGMGIASITQKQNHVVVMFRPDAGVNPASLTAVLREGRGKYLFRAGTNPYLTVKVEKDGEKKILEELDLLLKRLGT